MLQVFVNYRINSKPYDIIWLKKLYILLSTLIDSEDIYLEPSALAGISGSFELFRPETGQKYIEKNKLKDKMKNASHIAWATGGSMVPKDVMEAYYEKGKGLSL